MGRVGYVKAGYRWLRRHAFLVPIQTMPEPICAERRNCLLKKLSRGKHRKSADFRHKKTFYTGFFMQGKTNITL